MARRGRPRKPGGRADRHDAAVLARAAWLKRKADEAVAMHERWRTDPYRGFGSDLRDMSVPDLEDLKPKR